ncbi:VF530 family protein [uncultured Psychrosphaera sp.]|uniref:VF530 family protein n=1 Tax=uncultured Psychrosphaera sp. TaxID=1403522 RepID=UPI002627F1CD|nr:VF530 family protein [uncultured Psychrosphaera sp.]
MSTQINNPLHGITLQNLLTDLVDYYGWEYLAEQIEVRCFMFDPTIKSSLKFLRKTQWARDKVEAMYLAMLAEKVENPVEDPWGQRG